MTHGNERRDNEEILRMLATMLPPDLAAQEDRCEVCGALIGIGHPLFHVGRCDKHLDEEEA